MGNSSTYCWENYSSTLDTVSDHEVLAITVAKLAMHLRFCFHGKALYGLYNHVELVGLGAPSFCVGFPLRRKKGI